MDLEKHLTQHLRSIGTAPFLFIGSGMSRRYLGLDDWPTLLTRMAALTRRPYEYFFSTADGDLPRTASLIADALREPWWSERRFAVSRNAYPNPAHSESPLKIEVARYLQRQAKAGLAALDRKLRAEMELLRSAARQMDGVITTNYDSLAADLFPDFTVLVGQDQVLFRNFQGVGEIYQIHGSVSMPDSLVLTERDYARFNDRDTYLAAKLLTIFVEHPVIFLGYSLSDRNVRRILGDIAKVLTPDTVSSLQDRLIFINWSRDPIEPTMSATVTTIDGQSIPIQAIQLHDFTPVFACLAGLQRQYSARLLRHLKEQIYEMVRVSRPTGRIRVVDFENDDDLDKIDVVIGVAIHDKLAKYGLVGISREELFTDLLAEDSIYESAAETIVTESLRNQFSGVVPFYRWLRAAGRLADDGQITNSDGLLAPIITRVAQGAKYSRPADGLFPQAERATKDVKTLAEFMEKQDDWHVLQFLWLLPDVGIDLNLLRNFLLKTRPTFGSTPPWKKAACYYDYLAYGPKR
jgi:hypothetical protein